MFDHASDLNDHPVIERRGGVLKQRHSQGGKITWVAVEGDGVEARGSKDESEIMIISGDALVLGKIIFPSLGFHYISPGFTTESWILVNYCLLFWCLLLSSSQLLHLSMYICTYKLVFISTYVEMIMCIPDHVYPHPYLKQLLKANQLRLVCFNSRFKIFTSWCPCLGGKEKRILFPTGADEMDDIAAHQYPLLLCGTSARQCQLQQSGEMTQRFRKSRLDRR